MNHFIRIYTEEAAAYHRMIAAEDIDNQIYPALEEIQSIKGSSILDLGTGTGRLPLLISDKAKYVVGIDLHMHMIRKSAINRKIVDAGWDLGQADLRALPFPAGSFDLVTAGWAMGHFCGWFPDTWKEEIGFALSEARRVLAPGGAIAILETLTTGSLTPAPPTKALEAYYALLENEYSFERQEIRTDYQFASVDEAVELTEFFFGADMSLAIRKNNWSRLPEWTGVWGRNFP